MFFKAAFGEYLKRILSKRATSARFLCKLKNILSVVVLITIHETFIKLPRDFAYTM